MAFDTDTPLVPKVYPTKTSREQKKNWQEDCVQTVVGKGSLLRWNKLLIQIFFNNLDDALPEDSKCSRAAACAM